VAAEIADNAARRQTRPGDARRGHGSDGELQQRERFPSGSAWRRQQPRRIAQERPRASGSHAAGDCLDSTLKPEVPEALREISKTPKPQLRRAYTVTVLAVVTVALLGYASSERTRTPNPATLLPEQPEPVAPLSTPSKSGLPVSIERTDAVAASDVSVGVSTETAEPRRSADSITELVVTTEPAGARVTVNGIAWGVSPVTIPRLPPGDKRIRVTKEGYDSQERVLRLDEGQRRALDIPLEDTP
jgi:PEGA domain